MDVEKTMQFIIEQQAQFSADIQALSEASKEQDAKFTREMQALHQAQLRQLEVVNRLLDVTTEQGRGIHELAHRMDKRDADWEQRFSQLTQAQTKTERNLSALIQVVDGLARRS